MRTAACRFHDAIACASGNQFGHQFLRICRIEMRGISKPGGFRVIGYPCVTRREHLPQFTQRGAALRNQGRTVLGEHLLKRIQLRVGRVAF